MQNRNKEKEIFCILLTLLTLFSIFPSINGSFNNFHPYVLSKNQHACNGYTLLSMNYFPGNTENYLDAILIDMNGEEVKRWEIVPYPAKMLENGSIICGSGITYSPALLEVINMVQIDWQGNIIWKFNKWDDILNEIYSSRQHHDFQREGNPVGYYAPGQKFIDKGKTIILAHKNINNKTISNVELVDEVIYEVDWEGNLTGYEWHASDHFEEMGFNWFAQNGIRFNPGYLRNGDWLHINSISYLGENKWYDSGDERFNPDNIILDSRHANFIAIISRETGEIVWKVGPNYSHDTLEGAKLGQIIGMHNAHMIPKGLPGEGNILLFDNGGSAGYGFFGQPNRFRFYSRVIEFNPITFDIVWEYSHITGLFNFPRRGELHHFYSIIFSSAQRLPNGNTLITEGKPGRVIEVNPNGDVIWEYVTPTKDQRVYRAYRVPPEWVPGNPANYKLWCELY